MRRIILVAFEGATTLDVAGPAEVFSAAARRSGSKKSSYEVLIASVGGGARNTTAGLTIATRDLRRLRPTPDDTVIVSGGEEAAIRDTIGDPRLLDWLRRAAPVVARLGSVCSGSFLLAAAGLLDGKRATTHWSACDRLAKIFPAVTVDPKAIFVVDTQYGDIWTSAGVTTGIDMSLAMVEADHGRALADTVAAALVLYVRRPGFQSQFSEAMVAQTAGSDPLGPLIAWIRGHLRQANVETLARAAALSVRTLHRRCLELVGLTPAKLIDKLRVEHARTLLATSTLPAKELAELCGFGTATNMKRAFERQLGVGPREYRLLHSQR